MKNHELMQQMSKKQMAATMMCPNESGMGFIECHKDDNASCFDCCLNFLEQEAPRCRVCGCTAVTPCPGGCYWVEKDLCSRCAEKGKRTK